MQTAVFKPVIFLKKRWLVLIYSIIILINMLLICSIFNVGFISASEKSIYLEREEKSVIDQNDFSKYYSSKRMVPIYKVDRNDKKISLTIDGAWGSAKTEAILDLFSEYDIKISFFFAGRWLENNKNLAGKILAEGHQIYNHSYNHPHFNSLSREEIQIELKQTEEIITELRNQYLPAQKTLQENNYNSQEYPESLKIYEEYIQSNMNHQFPLKLEMLISNNKLAEINDLEDVNELFELSKLYEINNLSKITDLNRYNLQISLYDKQGQKSSNQIKSSIENHKNTKNKLNKKLKLFRPPYGEYNDQVVQTAREMDYQIIQWSLDSHDWMNPGREYVIKRIKNNVESGDILLFHNNSPEIIEILQVLIPYLNDNFKIVQIDELIYKDNYMIRSFDGLQYLVKGDIDEN